MADDETIPQDQPALPGDPSLGGWAGGAARRAAQRREAQPAGETTPPPDDGLLPSEREAHDNDVDLKERARLNQVNAYYRNTLFGTGRLALMAHTVQTPDDEKVTPQMKAVNDDLRKEYGTIVADLARYDVLRPWSNTFEAATALGGSLSGSILSPESTLGWASAGRTALTRTLKAAFQQGSIQAVVDPVVQWLGNQAGVEHGYDPTKTAMAFGTGAIVGGGMHGIGELISNLTLKKMVAKNAIEDPSFKSDMTERVSDDSNLLPSERDGGVVASGIPVDVKKNEGFRDIWRAENEHGWVSASADEGQKLVEIHASSLAPGTPIGQGYGTDLYRAIIDKALAEGYVVESSRAVSTDARRLYEGLERKGYTVETINPEGTKGPREPVYRITGGPPPWVAAPQVAPQERSPIHEDIETRLRHAGMGDEEAQQNAAIVAARYNARAERLGVDPVELYKNEGIEVGRGEHGDMEGKSFLQEQPRAEPFYSAVERAVTESKQDKAPASQWLGTLKNKPGVKPEEMEWLGLEDWLKEQQGSVTKDQIADYIRANRVEVREVEKGGENQRPAASRVASIDDQLNFIQNEFDRLHQFSNAAANERRATLAAQERALRTERFEIVSNWQDQAGTRTKFSVYQLPGGENYRELLLTLPDTTGGAAARMTELERRLQNAGDYDDHEVAAYRREYKRLADATAGQAFTGSHWDEPNVLAHVRFNDRTIDGKKTLFIEEIQSDWGQAARKRGYAGETPRLTEAELEESRALNGRSMGGDPLSPTEKARADDLHRRHLRSMSDVPDAPFIRNTGDWASLSLKRMIRYAAEHSYEQVAWTSGKTQAERYPEELRRAVGNIGWSAPSPDGMKYVHAKPREGGMDMVFTVNKEGVIIEASNNRAKGQHVEDVFGKDMAQQIMEKPEGDIDAKDFVIGAKGMEGFYDKMLPAAANKLTKKYGGKVERAEIVSKDTPTDVDVPFIVRNRAGEIVERGIAGEDYAAQRAGQVYGTYEFDPDFSKTKRDAIHALPITKDLRDAAVSEGFPLFQHTQEGEPRGRITLADNKAIVDLFGKADRSTFMHEMGHKWLDELVSDASRENIPQALKDDLGTVLRWLNVEKAEDIGTPQHEQWARGFEQYLREGKAPSSALAKAFDSFKKWLMDIYKSLSELGTPVSDDIRSVMDRMLATDAEIAAQREAQNITGKEIADLLRDVRDNAANYAPEAAAPFRDAVAGKTDEELVSLADDMMRQQDQQRSPAVVPPAESIQPITSPIPNGIAAFKPSDLLVDAERFQFKAGGDEAGVTERLKGVTQWDPIKAGAVLVWQDNAGKNFIVDGHQRQGLAVRIAANDPSQDVQLIARVLRESNGITPEMARAVAAMKNIAEGTGTAVDAAKVIRDHPELAGDLPPRSELVRQARGLVNLDTDAFRMVVNEIVPPNYAAIVGQLVPADGPMQGALIRLLAKTEPANAIQAEAIVRQGIAAGRHVETQGGLFGDRDVAESLYLERAKVLDRALKDLRRDKTVFSTLVKESDILEQAGNTLAKDINEKRASTDAQALQIVQILANRTGPIADALNAAARAVKESGNYANATREFIAAVRGSVETGDLARLADGIERGPHHVGTEDKAGVIDINAAPLAEDADRGQMILAEIRRPQMSKAAFDAEMARRKVGREAFKSEIEKAFQANGRFEMQTNRPGSKWLLTKNMGAVEGEPPLRITFFDGAEPTGHIEIRDFAEAAKELSAWRPKPAAEPGAEGLPQLILPGAEQSAKQLAASREGALRPKVAQKEPGGLFAPKVEPEPDLFKDILALRAAKAQTAGTRFPEEKTRPGGGIAQAGAATPPARVPPATTVPAVSSPLQIQAVQSLQQQVRNLETALNIPIRAGRVELKGAEGTFNTKTGVIRIGNIADFETAGHEWGHAFEARVGQDLTDLTDNFAAELASLVTDPSAYPVRMHVKEGFAEYIRRYLGNPAHAEVMAPGFTAAFRSLMQTRNPSMLKAMDDAAKAYRAYLEAPSTDAVASVVRSVSDNDKGWGGALAKVAEEGFSKSVMNVMRWAYHGLSDQFSPVDRAMREVARAIREAEGKDVVDLKAVDNPAIRLRMLGRAQQAAVVDAMKGVIPYQSVHHEGPSLSEAMAKAMGDDSVWGSWDEMKRKAFNAYLIARRSAVLWQKFEAGALGNPPAAFSKGDALTAMADFEGAHPTFREASDMVHGYSRQLLRKMYESGLIDKDLHDRLAAESFYVPFMRDMSDKPLSGGGTGGSADGPGMTRVIAKMKGSQRDIIDPIESLLTQTFLVNRTIRHNDVIKAFVDFFGRAKGVGGRYVEPVTAQEARRYTFDLGAAIERKAKDIGMSADDARLLAGTMSDLSGEDPLMGSFFKMEPTSKRGEPIVFYKDGGQLKAVRFMNEAEGMPLYELVTAMPHGLSDMAAQIMGTSAGILRSGIVTNPVFMLTNFIRDQVAVGILRSDYIPFYHGIKGIIGELTQGEVRGPIQYIGEKLGLLSEPTGPSHGELYGYAGGVSAGAHIAPLEQAGTMAVDALKRSGYLSHRVQDLHGLLEIMSVSEAGTRNSIFKTVYDAKRAQGLSEYEAMWEAAFQAQDILDFSRWGSKTEAIRALTPFFNAHLQGLDKARRTLFEPIVNRVKDGYLFEGDKEAYKNALLAWTKLLGVGGVLGAAWAAIHANDRAYRDAPPELIGTHFVTSVNGKYVVVPKPFELGLGFTAGEYAFKRLMQEDARAAGHFMEAAWEVIKPPMPIFDNPLIKTTYEIGTGQSTYPNFWKGRPIVPDALAGQIPAEQYTDRTSYLAKQIGKLINVSPMKVDHAIGGYFGLWGRDAMAVSNAIEEDRPVGNWADHVFIRRFIKDPTRMSDVTTQFWGVMARTSGTYNQAVTTYDNYVGRRSVQGDADARGYLNSLAGPQRAFVALKSGANEDGKPAFNADEKRLHPLQRAYDATMLLNGMRREMDKNNFAPWATKEAVKLTEDQRGNVRDNIRELAQMEMFNALTILKAPGYEGRAILDTLPTLEKIGKISPEVAEDIAARYATAKIYTTQAVRAAYPQLQRRLLQDGSNADIGDLAFDAKGEGYEFSGDRVRKPPKLRAPISGVPVQ